MIDDGPVAIGRGVRFDVAPGARVVLGAGVVLGDRCRIHVGSGEVSIGAGTILGERCVVTAHERVAIGARCLLGDEVVLIDLDHRFDDVERPVRLQGVRTGPVAVGDGVRIGPGAAVLRGVVLGAGAVVGAHAVVTRDVGAGVVVEGVPARPLRPVGRARR
jgi:acetyltransferase-like isoleucine patch superfamily enzyme